MVQCARTFYKRTDEFYIKLELYASELDRAKLVYAQSSGVVPRSLLLSLDFFNRDTSGEPPFLDDRIACMLICINTKKATWKITNRQPDDTRDPQFRPNVTASGEESNSINRFWVNHDVIRIMPLSAIIKDVRNFLDVARGEVVIMDFHRFPVGFEGRPSRHRRLATILHREFGDLILKPDKGVVGLGPTLNDIWTGAGRLIICYGDKHTVNAYEWLWPSLPQAWGNQQTVEGLFKYLDEVIMGPKRSRNSPNPLWAVMAELTPYPLDIIFKPSGGLRQMADAVNRNLTMKFQEKWWKETNIVATDFFLGNYLIDTSIQSNIKKSNIAQWRFDIF